MLRPTLLLPLLQRGGRSPLCACNRCQGQYCSNTTSLFANQPKSQKRVALTYRLLPPADDVINSPTMLSSSSPSPLWWWCLLARDHIVEVVERFISSWSRCCLVRRRLDRNQRHRSTIPHVSARCMHTHTCIHTYLPQAFDLLQAYTHVCISIYTHALAPAPRHPKG